LTPVASRSWLARNAPALLLGVALAVAAAVLFDYASGLAPFQDSWEFLLSRRDPSLDAFLQPHNEHIVLIPVAIDQLLLAIFGIGSTTPEYVVLVALLLATAVLVFVYVRSRVGPWLALAAAVLLLFLGPGWQDLLWPFQIGFAGSALFGVATLLALERADRRWDVAACAFLVAATGFSSLGLAFVLAAAVDVFQRRRERGLRRAYVFLVPAALYGLWFLGWGHDAETHLSAHNVLVSPWYTVKGFGASLDSLLALGTITGEPVGRSSAALPLLAALLALAAYAIWRGRRPSPRTWPLLAAAAGFWLPAAFNFIPGREAYSSRYVYVGAIFVLLIAAELLRGIRPRPWAIAVAVAVAAALAVVNLAPLREGRDFFRQQTALTRADLGSIEIARDSVDPGFTLTPEIAGTPFLVPVGAGPYLEAVREEGSPAYSPAELAAASAAARKQADVVLANALPVTTSVEAEAGPTAAGEGCVSVSGGADAPSQPLRPGATEVHVGPGGPATIRLRRFATAEYPLVTEGVAGGSRVTLEVPADAASRPWQLQVEAAQGATVCR
jgi:hypothetical protein